MAITQSDKESILNIKVRYEDAIYGVMRFQEKIEDLKKSQKELKEQFEDGAIGYDEYKTQVTATDAVITQYKDNVRALKKELQNNVRQEQQNEGSLKQLRAALSNATKAYDEMSRAEREGAEGKALQEHINDITDELKKAEEGIQNFHRNVGNYEESVKSAIFGNSQFGQSLQALADMAGDSGGIIGGLKEKFEALRTAVMGFVSNPYVLAIMGVAGAGMAFKWWYDYNDGLTKATKLTQQFTGLTGTELRGVRNDVQTLADLMDTEFQETLISANALAKGFGISMQESLKLMQDGFISGANANGEMLDVIKEYPRYFKEAGISAETFMAITVNASKQGVFSDKGVDTIKEANLRLREMTTATAAALDGIGISSQKVQEELRNGQKTTFEVMQDVSARLKELPQTSAEVGAAIADIFGGPGEDAGLQYIESLSTVSTKMDVVKKKSGELAKAQEAQIQANKELTNVMTALFDRTGGGFELMKSQIITIATKALTSLIRGIVNVINYCIDLYNTIGTIRVGLQAVRLVVSVLWKAFKTIFSAILNGAKAVVIALAGIGTALEGVITLNVGKIKKGITDVFNSIPNALKSVGRDLDKYGSDLANEFVDGFNQVIGTAKVAHIKIPEFSSGSGSGTIMRTDGTYRANGAGTKATSGNTGAKKARVSTTGTNTAEQARKEQEELRKAEDLLSQIVVQSTEERRKQVKREYDRQIADLEKRLEKEKGLTTTARDAINVQIQALEQIKNKKLQELSSQALQESIKREQEYIAMRLETVKKGSDEEYHLQLSKIQNEKQLALDAANAAVVSEEEKQRNIWVINEKYNKLIEDADKAHLEAVRQAREEEINKQFTDKMVQMGAEGNGTDNIDEITKLQLGLQQRQSLLDAANAAEYASVQERNAAILEAQNEFNNAQARLDEARSKISIANWNAVGSAVSAAQGLMEAFGDSNKALTAASKVLALAQIAISTGVAIAEGVKQAQSVPFPGNIAAIATTVATILTNITTAIKTVKGAKFAQGGDVVGEGTGTSDSIHARLSNGESVMTAAATSMFAPALSAFNQIGGGVPIYGQNTQQQIGEEYLANAVARGMAQAPRPVVSVEEITSVRNRVETIERLGKI